MNVECKRVVMFNECKVDVRCKLIYNLLGFSRILHYYAQCAVCWFVKRRL